MVHESRGFGFIATGQTRDVFFYHANCADYASLRPGDQVTFDMSVGKDGRECAVNVEVIQ